MRSDRVALLAIPLTAAALGAQGSAQAVVHKPFETFTPGACAVAPMWVDHFASRDVVDNTIYTPARDTTSRLAADSVRICRTGFGGGTNDEWELLNLARVELIVGEDSLARATGARYLRTLGNVPARRAWALFLITSDHLRAGPARFEVARQTLRELDALGAPAGEARVLAHSTMSAAALRHFDEPVAVREADATIAIWKTLPRELALELAMNAAAAYVRKAEIALRGTGIPAAQAIIAAGDSAMPPAGGARNVIEAYKKMYAVLGKPAAAIEAKYWFGSGIAAGGRPQVSIPTRGRVTLLSGSTHACGVICRERYRGLRRMGARFGDRIDFVTMTKTLGFHTDTAPIQPVDEAKYDSSYFLGTKALPGMLSVFETVYTFIPDGRRRNQQTPQDVNYPFASVVIVDRKGLVRYVSEGWNSALEELLARHIEKLIAEP